MKAKVTRQDCPTHLDFIHELFVRNHEINNIRFFDEKEGDGVIQAESKEEAIKQILCVLESPDERLIKIEQSSPGIWTFRLPLYVTLRELTQVDIDKYAIICRSHDDYNYDDN